MIMKVIAVLKNPVVKGLFLAVMSDLVMRYSTATLEIIKEKLDKARETNKGDKDASENKRNEEEKEAHQEEETN